MRTACCWFQWNPQIHWSQVGEPRATFDDDETNRFFGLYEHDRTPSRIQVRMNCRTHSPPIRHCIIDTLTPSSSERIFFDCMRITPDHPRNAGVINWNQAVWFIPYLKNNISHGSEAVARTQCGMSQNKRDYFRWCRLRGWKGPLLFVISQGKDTERAGRG